LSLRERSRRTAFGPVVSGAETRQRELVELFDRPRGSLNWDAYGSSPGKPASVHATFAHNHAPHLTGSSEASHQECIMFTTNVPATRFVGLDVHKRSVMVGAVDAQQRILLRPFRLSWGEFETWCAQHLQATDAVVLEATTNAWHLYDQLAPRVVSVTIANPLLIKWISSASIKTDGHDTLKLARLLAAGLVPAVWVPPEPVRQLRALLSHRRRLIRQRTQARNRLHSVLHRHNLTPPEGELFAAAQRDWWLHLDLLPMEQLLVTQDLQLLDAVAPLIDQVEQQLCLESVKEPWTTQVPYLVQQTGIGVLTAMILLAAIGDISRFPRAPQLVGYAGLGAAVHASADTHHAGGITKQGRRDLRAAMVEAAWTAVTHNPDWKARFEHLCRRLSREKAIVAIARQMLVVVWHIWHDREPDRHTDAVTIARKMMTWAEQGGKAMRHGLTATQFVRVQLDQLKIGQDLAELPYGSHVYKLPATGSVKAADVR
jgi:transposase